MAEKSELFSASIRAYIAAEVEAKGLRDLADRTGVDSGQLCRYLRDGNGLGLPKIDAIAAELGLRVIREHRPS